MGIGKPSQFSSGRAKCRAICKLLVIFFERRAFSGQEKDKNISIKLFWTSKKMMKMDKSVSNSLKYKYSLGGKKV